VGYLVSKSRKGKAAHFRPKKPPAKPDHRRVKDYKLLGQKGAESFDTGLDGVDTPMQTSHGLGPDDALRDMVEPTND
jgi:hypothetical protein